MKEKLENQCECRTKTQPFLIFDNSDENEAVKSRARLFFKNVEEHLPVEEAGECEDGKLASSEQQGEDEEYRTDDDRGKQLWRLFLKMLSLGMDRHALAIADGYRIKPQVCVCDDVCCTCFNYSAFLHNLKLHEHKGLLLREFDKLMAKQRVDSRDLLARQAVEEKDSKSGETVVDKESGENLQSEDWQVEDVEIGREDDRIRPKLTKGETDEIWKMEEAGEDFRWGEELRWSSGSVDERRFSEAGSFSKKYPSQANSKESVSSRVKIKKCECRRKDQIDKRELTETDLVRSKSGIAANEIEGELKSSYWTVLDRFLEESKRENSGQSVERKKTLVPTVPSSSTIDERRTKAPSPFRLSSSDSLPFETLRNSVHKRVREFDPDSYKTLVKGEARKLNEIPEPERKLGADNRISRPPWKI